jgi:hypothetical protein
MVNNYNKHGYGEIAYLFRFTSHESYEFYFLLIPVIGITLLGVGMLINKKARFCAIALPALYLIIGVIFYAKHYLTIGMFILPLAMYTSAAVSCILAKE